MANNPNCDGSGPCRLGEVRVLPSGGDSNLILCRNCFNSEIRYRIDRNNSLAKENRFDIPHWSSLKIYGEPQNHSCTWCGDSFNPENSGYAVFCSTFCMQEYNKL